MRDVSDIKNCYQVADPTSSTDSELVATDGGTIRIDGAYDIKALIPSGSGLLVLAKNGVWRIVGGSDFGFGAVNFRVERISNNGCRSAASVVYVDGSVIYWGDDGIYTTTTSEIGDWSSVNLITDKIQTFYNNISSDSKEIASGLFDHFERKVRWLYNISSTEDTRELVFDVDLGSFYLNIIAPTSTNFPYVVDIVKVNPFTVEQLTSEVTVQGVTVTAGGETVTVTTDVQSSVSREAVYVTITSASPTLVYTLSTYRNAAFTDWFSFDGAGVDAPSIIVTGQLNTGENSLRKKNKSLVMHMKRTEEGMTLNDNGKMTPNTPSSVLVQAQWDWTTSTNSNRWSTPRQYYKPRRLYLPTDIDDLYDTGFSTVVTKDILRGHGKALNLKFTSEPKKNMHIHGWTMVWGIGEKIG